jgi:UDP-glucose 4-epimerase
MTILVTGAGGFLGRSVVARLLQRGHKVRAMIRPQAVAPAWPNAVEIVRADLRVTEDLMTLLDGVGIVVHLASATSGNEDVQFASTVVGTEKLIDAMALSETRRLVLVSSLVVYDWSRARGSMDEQTPLEDNIYSMGGYTIAKAWQERIVRRAAAAHRWDLTVLRPGFIWGPEHAEIAGMGRHFWRIYLMFGPFTRLPLTHVENCADAVAAAVDNPGAVGEIFNVVDDDSINVWRYVKEFAKRTGQTGLLVPIPYWFGYSLALLAALVSLSLFGKKGKLPSLLTPRRFQAQFKPIRFSNQKLLTLMNWRPPLTFDDCLRVTYDDTWSVDKR